MKILYLVRSYPPYWSNRQDFDLIIKNLIKKGDEAYIFDIKDKKIIFCNSNIVTYLHYFTIKLPGFLLNIKPIYLLTNFINFYIFLIKNKKSFDICHILYLREEQLILKRFIKKISSHIIISIYGSDFNKNNIIKKYFTGLLQAADYITFTNSYLLRNFLFAHKNMNQQLKKKAKVFMFPQYRLSRFKQVVFSDKFSARKKLLISKYNIIIVIGNNASDIEPHYRMINEIKKNNLLRRKDILLVFPVTYGNHKEKVIKLLKQNLDEYNKWIISDYLSEDDLFNLRLSTDIYINLRTADQLVASMLESIAAYSQVLTGTWLPYQILDDIGVKINKIDAINKLNSEVNSMIKYKEENHEDLFVTLKNNSRIILDYFDYKKNMKEWMEFYDTLRNKI